jgi:hypothetical protein
MTAVIKPLGKNYGVIRTENLAVKLCFHNVSRQITLTNCSSSKNHKPVLEMVAFLSNGILQVVYETCPYSFVLKGN